MCGQVIFTTSMALLPMPATLGIFLCHMWLLMCTLPCLIYDQTVDTKDHLMQKKSSGPCIVLQASCDGLYL